MSGLNYLNLKRHYQSDFPTSLWPQKVRPGDTQRVAWLGLAKYDSSKISRFLGIWLDLFSYGDSTRKDYRLGKDQFQNAL